MVAARMVSRCVVSIIFSLLFISAVYLLVFHKPPPEVTLAANKSKRSTDSKALMEKDVKDMTPQEFSRAKWDAWVDLNKYVSIGEVYDSCDEKTRITTGRVIMMKDPATGGLMSRTFFNTTFTNTITAGDMGIQVWYNGQDLFKNHWELCHLEDDFEETERIIFCPIKAGKHKYIKDMPIPKYLPKGVYQTKSWSYDQNDKNIGCVFTDFTL